MEVSLASPHLEMKPLSYIMRLSEWKTNQFINIKFLQIFLFKM